MPSILGFDIFDCAFSSVSKANTPFGTGSILFEVSIDCDFFHEDMSIDQNGKSGNEALGFSVFPISRMRIPKKYY